ncbi:MAG: hypothetical protein F6K63_16115 [Moorea sp. SIO1G6]|nr:hypothetical protein [Moorena sp. SIO1G6]
MERGIKKTIAAMQRGLGGFPHERLHQDTDTLHWSAAHKRAIAILRTGM